jgi:hypothetical protein
MLITSFPTGEFRDVILIWTGYAVVHLVETLCNKLEGRGFDWRWVCEIFHWPDPSGCAIALGSSHLLAYQGSSLGSKGSRCVRLTTLLPSCAEWKSWELEPQPPVALRARLGLYRDSVMFYLKMEYGHCVIFISWLRVGMMQWSFNAHPFSLVSSKIYHLVHDSWLFCSCSTT